MKIIITVLILIKYAPADCRWLPPPLLFWRVDCGFIIIIIIIIPRWLMMVVVLYGGEPISFRSLFQTRRRESPRNINHFPWYNRLCISCSCTQRIKPHFIYPPSMAAECEGWARTRVRDREESFRINSARIRSFVSIYSFCVDVGSG